MIYLALSAILLALSSAKGPCDMKEECKGYAFTDTSTRPLCIGYQACKNANFGVKAYNPKCMGDKSCFNARFSVIPVKVICNGFKGCQGAGNKAYKNLVAEDKIGCNGYKSCTNIAGQITARKVVCDGDMSCAYEAIEANDVDAVYPIDIACNGFKACTKTRMSADEVECDGDLSCKAARRIQTNTLICSGKKSCIQTKVAQVSGQIYAYGMAGLGKSYVVATGTTLMIKAMGFSSLVKTEVLTSGTAVTLKAYGHRAFVGGLFKCFGGSTCIVKCKTNACKSAIIGVDKKSTLIIEPAECATTGQTSSKKTGGPGRISGINCPLIVDKSNTPADVPPLTEEEWDQIFADAQSVLFQDEETQEIFDELDNDEDEQYMEQQLAELEAMYDEMEQEEELEFVVEGNQLLSGHKSLSSGNLMVALAAFIITLTVSVCYYAYKQGKQGVYKPLLTQDV